MNLCCRQGMIIQVGAQGCLSKVDWPLRLVGRAIQVRFEVIPKGSAMWMSRADGEVPGRISFRE